MRTTLAREAVLLNVNGAIGPATTAYLRRAFKRPADRDAALIILRMDTPGGLDTATREIVRDILASPLPIVAYVGPSGARAASAGTYILYASHLAAMAPGTNLGAATPVQLGVGGSPSAAGPATAVAMTRTTPRTLRPTPMGQGRQRRRRLHPRPGRPARPQRGLGGSGGARSGEPPGEEALEQRVIEIVAGRPARSAPASPRALCAPAAGEHETRYGRAGDRADRADWRTRLLATITDPNIAYILMLVGIYGVIFEFVPPGTVLPGVVGAICLLVGLFALHLLPVNYAGAGLIALGIALMVGEAFAPSVVLGIGGIAAFAIGSIFLFETGTPGFSFSPGSSRRRRQRRWRSFAGGRRRALAPASRRHRQGSAHRQSGEVLNWDGRRAKSMSMASVGGRAPPRRSPRDNAYGSSARDRLTLAVEPEAERPPRVREGRMPIDAIVLRHFRSSCCSASSPSAIRIMREYERAVVFTLGRFSGREGAGA